MSAGKRRAIAVNAGHLQGISSLHGLLSTFHANILLSGGGSAKCVAKKNGEAAGRGSSGGVGVPRVQGNKENSLSFTNIR